jgi:hypothetical protein
VGDRLHAQDGVQPLLGRDLLVLRLVLLTRLHVGQGPPHILADGRRHPGQGLGPDAGLDGRAVVIEVRVRAPVREQDLQRRLVEQVLVLDGETLPRVVEAEVVFDERPTTPPATPTRGRVRHLEHRVALDPRHEPREPSRRVARQHRVGALQHPAGEQHPPSGSPLPSVVIGVAEPERRRGPASDSNEGVLAHGRDVAEVQVPVDVLRQSHREPALQQALDDLAGRQTGGVRDPEREILLSRRGRDGQVVLTGDQIKRAGGRAVEPSRSEQPRLREEQTVVVVEQDPDGARSPDRLGGLKRLPIIPQQDVLLHRQVRALPC